MLRARWGLNGLLPDHNRAAGPKNRTDHRHHAIDAFVIACTDLGLLNRIARASGQAEKLDLDRLYPKDEFPLPFEGYREALGARLNSIVISHKPDHGLPPGGRAGAHVTSGKLLEDTAYGLVDEEIDGKPFNLVVRKPLRSLTRRRIGQVRDPDLRRKLQRIADQAVETGQKLDDVLAEFGKKHGIDRVRVLETEESVRGISHGAGYRKAYVPGDNHRIEIYELQGIWKGEGVTVFDANRPGFEPQWRRQYPNARLIMRVHRGDLIEADFGEGRKVYLVCTLDASANRLKLALHNEAGSLQNRHDDPDDPFRYEMKAYSRLKAAKAQRVRVDPLGRVQPVLKEP